MKHVYPKLFENMNKDLQKCIDDMRNGELTEKSLRNIKDQLNKVTSTCQDVLYLHVKNSSPIGEVIGMRIIENGEISDGPKDPKKWPYKTVLEAIKDGWRVIKFPEIAHSLDDNRTYGLGYEFILER